MTTHEHLRSFFRGESISLPFPLQESFPRDVTARDLCSVNGSLFLHGIVPRSLDGKGGALSSMVMMWWESDFQFRMVRGIPITPVSAAQISPRDKCYRKRMIESSEPHQNHWSSCLRRQRDCPSYSRKVGLFVRDRTP